MVSRSPVKLVIQVPCLNEEATLASVLDSMPMSVPGVDVIDIVVIDDGSTDATVPLAVAAQLYGLQRFLDAPADLGLGLPAQL